WTMLLLAGALWMAYRCVTIGAGAAYVQEVDGTLDLASPTDAALGVARFSMSHTIGLWLAAFFTLAIFSFLYCDNPIYKIAESILVCVSGAYSTGVAFLT